MVFSLFQANKKAKAAEVNANFAFIAGERLIAIDSTGVAYGTFPIGDLTAVANGSLAGDMLARTGNSLKVYNASGTLIGSVSYDDMLNLQSATETQEGTAEIATQAEVSTGTDDSRIITPLKFNAASLGWGQSWQDVTGSRAVSTSYANNTGRPIQVTVGVTLSNTTTFTNLVVGGVNASRVQGSGGGSYTFDLSAIVPNGISYSVSGGSPTLSTWRELR